MSDRINANGAGAVSPELPMGHFDLDTAWLRRAEADAAGFVGRFARIVSEALPRHAELVTVKRGLFRKTEDVVGVRVGLDNEVYLMQVDGRGGLATCVQHKVNGVVLSTREVPAAAWMQGLMGQVHTRTEQARGIVDLLKAV